MKEKRTVRTVLVVVLLACCLGAGTYSILEPSSDSNATEHIVAAAQDFLKSLDPALQDKATFAFADDARKNWSNLPWPLVERQGVTFGDMSPEARVKAHQLFQTVLSSQGYLKVSGIMYLDDVLTEISSYRTEDGGMPFGSEFYWMGIFGTPAPDSAWGWQLNGHHLALNITVAGDEIAVTPTFMGTDPAEIRVGANSGWRILGAEDDLGLQLIGALDEEQQVRAILADTARPDVFAGPGKGDAVKEIEGLPAADMTPDQRALLVRLIEEYVGNLNDELAAVQMARLQDAGIEDIHFAWMGPARPSPLDRYYYRIHGERVLIEFDNSEPPGQVGVPVNHVHTIWRDPANDFGKDALRRHYEESPHH